MVRLAIVHSWSVFAVVSICWRALPLAATTSCWKQTPSFNERTAASIRKPDHIVNPEHTSFFNPSNYVHPCFLPLFSLPFLLVLPINEADHGRRLLLHSAQLQSARLASAARRGAQLLCMARCEKCIYLRCNRLSMIGPETRQMAAVKAGGSEEKIISVSESFSVPHDNSTKRAPLYKKTLQNRH